MTVELLAVSRMFRTVKVVYVEMSRGFLYDAEIRCEDVSSSLTCFYIRRDMSKREKEAGWQAHIAQHDCNPKNVHTSSSGTRRKYNIMMAVGSMFVRLVVSSKVLPMATQLYIFNRIL